MRSCSSWPWAPWYAIPADNKPYLRARVAEIVINALEGIGLRYPERSEEDRVAFAAAHRNSKTIISRAGNRPGLP